MFFQCTKKTLNDSLVFPKTESLKLSGSCDGKGLVSDCTGKGSSQTSKVKTLMFVNI